jgi:MFS superfamily sulfate permease-like transporter
LASDQSTLPIIGAMRTYDVHANLLGDVVAGWIVGIMLVPQGMAQARFPQSTAGMPR